MAALAYYMKSVRYVGMGIASLVLYNLFFNNNKTLNTILVLILKFLCLKSRKYKAEISAVVMTFRDKGQGITEHDLRFYSGWCHLKLQKSFCKICKFLAIYPNKDSDMLIFLIFTIKTYNNSY